MREQIILNSLRTPDGTVITSRYRHDYVTHEDANGGFYMVDGGFDYLRRSMNGDEVDLSQVLTEDHEHNRTYLQWGTRGPLGYDPLKYVPIYQLDTDHIEAILETQFHIAQWLKNVFEMELITRKILLTEITEEQSE